jgi:hypothetical protein
MKVEGGVLYDRTPHPYRQELTYTPGLSFGKPEDGAWRQLPAPPASAQPCIGPANESTVVGLNRSLLIVVTLLLPSSVGPLWRDA